MAEDGYTTIDISGATENPQKVEFELEDKSQEKEEIPSLNTSQEDNEEYDNSSKSFEKPEVKSEDTEKKQSRAEKRIIQLNTQKKAAEQEVERLRRELKERDNKLALKQKESDETLKQTLDSNEKQITDGLELAERAYETALESGDNKQIVSAQKALNNAQYKALDIVKSKEAFKRYQDQRAYEAELHSQFQQEQNFNQQPQTQYDKKAIEWAAGKEWFHEGNPLASTAINIDTVMRNEGQLDPSTDEYYEELEERLQAIYPGIPGLSKTKSSDSRNEAPNNASQVVAGASRSPNPKSGSKIVLTEKDQEIAEKWGLPLKVYAANKKAAQEPVEHGYINIDTRRGGY